MTLNLSRPFTALTHGVIRRNQEVVEGLTAPTTSINQRVAAAIAFLRLGFPDATDEDFDTLTPGAIQAAAGDLYAATYALPE